MIDRTCPSACPGASGTATCTGSAFENAQATVWLQTDTFDTRITESTTAEN
jgi:hypothetical protein